MESNLTPEIKSPRPLERIKKIAHFLFDHITDPGLSDHANRGGAVVLDHELYGQPTQIYRQGVLDLGQEA